MNEKIWASRLRTITEILKSYQSSEPLSSVLKKHFLQNKKYGSKDRKAISDLMYSYFRLGNFCMQEPVEKRIAIAQYLFGDLTDEQKTFISAQTGIPEFPATFTERLNLASKHFASAKDSLFPLLDLAGQALDTTRFIDNLASKPDVWIRIRKDVNSVRQNLKKDGFDLRPSELLSNAFAVENPKNLELSGMYQKGNFEIQDFASQLCSSYIDVGDNARVWDACAGSGGKSLFVADRYPELNIHCTDIRPTIIQNLQTRARRAAKENIEASVLDVTDEKQLKSWPDGWTHVIADVPCTGSGTWGRTPEQMQNCTPEKIEEFCSLQKKILTNIASKTQKGGFVYYLTCSLFGAENEELTNWAVKTLDFRKVKEETVAGYEYRSDTMYFCKLQKL